MFGKGKGFAVSCVKSDSTTGPSKAVAEIGKEASNALPSAQLGSSMSPIWGRHKSQGLRRSPEVLRRGRYEAHRLSGFETRSARATQQQIDIREISLLEEPSLKLVKALLPFGAMFRAGDIRPPSVQLVTPY